VLHYIHTREREIVHRDVTPHNVFVTRDGHVKLGDFGVAKAEQRLSQTEHGQIKGKLAYLAPEQARGDDVSNRTDVYAAGAILFELLAGRRYNNAKTDVDVLSQAMTPKRVGIASIVSEAAPIARALDAALSPHPAMRTRDAALLSEQLAEYLRLHPFDARAMASFLAEIDAASMDDDFAPPRSSPRVEPQPGIIAQIPTQSNPTMPMPATTHSELPPLRKNRVAWILVIVALLAAATALAWVLGATGDEISAQVVDAGPPSSEADAAVDPGRSVADAAVADARAVEDVQRADDAEGPAMDSTLADAAIDVAAAAPRTRRWRRYRRGRRARLRRGRRPRVTPPPKAPAVKRPVVDKAPLWARLKRAKHAGRARGIWPGDNARYSSLLGAATRAIASGNSADGALGGVEKFVSSFTANQAFIKRKLGRLERAIGRAKVAAARRQQLNTASQRILRLILSQRLVEASRQISYLLVSLR